MAAVIGNASGDAQPATQSAAYEDALQRAREIAAKITPEVPGPMGDFSQKRPLEDAEPGAKKLASSQNDANVMGNAMSAAMGGSVRTEPFTLPDRLVGLVIGKGGDTITRLQSESGCRVQIAPESPAGSDERPCTLTGTPEQISRCSSMLTEILGNAGQNNTSAPPLSGDGTMTTIELMIPPDKCGIIIGKGGETIKSLKMNLGVQMNLIQDSTMVTGQQKPLRITGDPQRVEQAKQAVEQIMQQRDEQQMRAQGMGGQRRFENPNQGQGGENIGIHVPRPAVGVVIGKGGDMITRIQNETGTRIQFREDNPSLPNRLCSITGTPEGCRQAQVRVEELIQSVQEHDASGQTNRRRPGGSTFGQWEGPGMGGGRTSTVEYKVPANKTGLVIGKRGENIRQINQQSLAHVEIQRNPPPGSDPQFKTFIIKGTSEQIQHAQHLIQERVDGGPGGSSMSGTPQSGYGAPPVQNNYQTPPQGGYAPPSAPQAQGYGSQPAWNQQQYQQWTQPPQQNGTTDQNAKPNAQTAAWAAYYSSFYNNQQQPGAATTPFQQQVPGMPQMAGSAAPQGSDYTKAWEEYFKKQAEQSGGAAPQVPPTAGTPQPATSQANVDYSQQWADYYRQYTQYYQQAQYSAAGGQPAQQ